MFLASGPRQVSEFWAPKPLNRAPHGFIRLEYRNLKKRPWASLGSEKDHPYYGFGGPNSIIVDFMDPLGSSS